MRRGALACALSCGALTSGALTCGLTSSAGAQPAADGGLRYDYAIDLPVLGVGAAVWGATEVPFKGYLAGPCRICEPSGVDDAVRNALVWKSPGAADGVSNAMGFIAIPMLSVGLGGFIAAHDKAHFSDIVADEVVVAEATVMDALMNQLVKFAARRQRPFVHYDRHEYDANDPNDDNLSFYSAHTSVSMALAVSTGTVASMRGYAWAPIAWATLPALSLLTGYLRIAADKHYFTDVLTGALVGGGIGFIVPFAFHHSASSSATPALGVTPGPMATVSWLW